MIKTLSDLEVYNLAYSFAGDIFHASRSFPKEERYSLTDQIVRSSRSIAANIAEGWGRRIYENEFKKHLIYSLGSVEESKVWILFAKDCSYLSAKDHDSLFSKSENLGSKIYRLYENWKTH